MKDAKVKMITISVCMIVKNEEKVLARCLDSLQGIYDELIIVDTGSTDNTVEIAKKYTDKIYKFAWTNDFSEARNYSISFATSDYIYIADADEIIDSVNHKKFMDLKEKMLPQIEIVEMRYVNQLDNGTVYNYDSEYRPKLYKRLREFTFIDPVHEVVRLDPVVFESDIDIIHKPEKLHAKRDILIFEKMVNEGKTLSLRLLRMYARELLLSGSEEEFSNAAKYFKKVLNESDNVDFIKLSHIILSMNAANEKNEDALKEYAEADMDLGGSSEICSILGAYFELCEDYDEAVYWYDCAMNNAEPEVCLKYKEEIPKQGVERVRLLME